MRDNSEICALAIGRRFAHIRDWGGGKSPKAVMRVMRWSVTQFLSDLFPEIEGPRYQRTAETVSFVLVAAMLVGSLISSIVLLVYEL